MRTGIVLDRDTPAMNRLAGLVRWGLGGRIASGRQWVSWIHISDFLSVVRRALEDDRLSGVSTSRARTQAFERPRIDGALEDLLAR